jgi:hypothetical protein
MRLIRQIALLSMVSLFVALAGAAQQACTFTITGDWESTAPGASAPEVFRFAPDGTVTLLSPADTGGHAGKIARAAYKLDSSQPPKTLEFKRLPSAGSSAFPWGFGRLEIVNASDNSFATVTPGSVSSSSPSSWVRHDRDKYFVVMAAHRGTPPHFGGPAFVMLIRKPIEGEAQVDNFGLYYCDRQRINGPVPAEVTAQYMADLPPGEDAVLRVEVAAPQFSRAMKIVHDWQKRAAENTMLFPAYSYLNVVVPLKEVAESLNACGETIKLHQLTWMVDDEIGANFAEWELAYQYIKKLRAINEQANVSEATVQQKIGSAEVSNQHSAVSGPPNQNHLRP